MCGIVRPTQTFVKLFRAISCYTGGNSGYRAGVKTDSERGPLGAWARRLRTGKGLSVESVSEGIGTSPASYRGIEAGRWQPNADTVAALATFFGSPPPDTTKEPPPDWAKGLATKADIDGMLDTLIPLMVDRVWQKSRTELVELLRAARALDNGDSTR